ncbi:hypothetical protein D9758_017461 [Tetrapyrgos nigripes]|uniref:Uncharacterized protein n=1 Tax=Tetrapyrgos nigripes TaxID=182062 RepID=A0A8H5BRI8_9AGAR|nr:hypothetical protein D9758_017461 [Tetrapyrgos nigripes]
MTTALYFPLVGIQVLIFVIYFTGLSALSYCISHWITHQDTSSWNTIRQIRASRLLVFAVFVDSWLFIFSSGILIFGLGLETSPSVCGFAINLCVVFLWVFKMAHIFPIDRESPYRVAFKYGTQHSPPQVQNLHYLSNHDLSLLHPHHYDGHWAQTLHSGK